MVDTKLYEEIVSFCKLNEIEDINALINKMLKVGFMFEKYGNSPFQNNVSEPKTISTIENQEKKEKIKPKEQKNNQDIYGEENFKGRFGSNLLD